MAAIIGQIEAFRSESDDWEQYTERLEQYFLANSIDGDARKLAVLLTVIGSKTYALLSDLLAPEKPATKSYAELVEVLKVHLKPKRLIIAERFHFHQRVQEEGETVATYMAALRRLADKCEYGGHLTQALRDQFVCGLRGVAIQRKLLTMDGLTMEKAYESAYGMEAADRRAGELQASKAAAAGSASVNKVADKKPPTTTSGNYSPTSCFRCGKTNHHSDACYYKAQKCRKCGKLGHIARVCKSTRRPGMRTGYVGQELEPDEEVETSDDLPMLNIQMVKPTLSQSGIFLDLHVEGKPVKMELDTGASVSIISEKTWQEVFGAPQLTKCAIKLRTYTGQNMKVRGQKLVRVKYGNQECQLPLLVVAGKGPSLFGRNWLGSIQLDWGSIKQIRAPLEELLQEFEEVFRAELGTLRGVQATLELKPEAKPRFYRPRSVPYAIKGAIEKDLERLERSGIVEKVKYSDWAAPIVPVPKSDGGIRICGDYKVTVNPSLKIDQYPVPTAEDLFATLAGGKTFSKLDLSQAYQQVPLDPESRKYVTITTHKGLYQYKRLPFGVASAPAIFQEIMEKILHGIPGVVVYIDDILVTGTTDEEHLQSLKEVLVRLKQHGLRVKRAKCRFMVPSVEYLGYCIDKDGLHALPEKVAAIVEAPKPTNVQELRAFLGLVNYYGKFIHRLSALTYPLNRLLCKRARWVWNKACQEAFMKLKAQLASAEVLAHYDMHLPLKLDCDASAYGLGAVLSHKFPDGTERPIAYASRTLSTAEQNYAQIEKEGLALVFGIKKFHKYLYGRKFTLVTDHQPLMVILGPKKSLPTLAAARLQRWAILLLGYQYDLEFRPSGRHSNADGLSRLPRPGTTGLEKALEAGTVAFNMHQIESSAPSAKQLRDATMKDPLLSKVLRYAQGGWPKEVSKELQPYHQRRAELGIEAGCLFWGTRVIVPASMHAAVLAELHSSHPGIVRMKGVARAQVWWPCLNAAIEQTVYNCQTCQGNRKRPPHIPLNPWPWPTAPWERVHIDFAGLFMGYMYLVVVDSHSKWVEIVPMKSTTTEKTLEVLRELFARHGLPKQLISDNGPQFTAKEFEECMCANGIKHSRSAPYHPATNGEAERFVQTFKRSLQAGRSDAGTIQQKLSQFLLMYRTTPNATTGVAPAELFLKRKLRTRLDLLRPTVEGHVHEEQQKQKKYHDRHSQSRSYHVGQAVLVRNLRDGAPWLVGCVVEVLGPANYEVEVNGQVWMRHADQLMAYKGVQDTDTEPVGEAPLPIPPVPIVTESNAEATVNEELVAPSDLDTTPPLESSSPVPPVRMPTSPPATPVRVPTSSSPPPAVRTPTVPKTYPKRNRPGPDYLRPTF